MEWFTWSLVALVCEARFVALRRLSDSLRIVLLYHRHSLRGRCGWSGLLSGVWADDRIGQALLVKA